MSAIPSLLRPLALRCLAACAVMAALCASPALAANGDVDTTFTFAGHNTKCIAVQPDGRAVVAYGNTDGAGGRSLARLNEDGTKDPLFNATVSGVIHCIALQADGKILISGDISNVSGITRRRIARLLPDGSVDLAFSPHVDGRVSEMVVMKDGRILIGGNFYKVDGQPRYNIARLTADGVPDNTFVPILGDECSAIHVLADGRILVGGAFEDVNNVLRRGVARLSEDGVLDETFAPPVTAPDKVTWIAEQPDGKILMVLSWMSLEPFNARFMRVDPTTGAMDATYQNNLTNATIYPPCMQTDGKVVVPGRFTYNSTTYHLARLHPNGQFDSTLAVTESGPFPAPIHTIAPTASGKLLVGGDFTRIRTVNRAGIARLAAEAVTTPLVAPDLTSVEWQRSNTAPMLQRVTFESRTANGPWSFLGHGQWLNGKWRLDNTTLPANGVVRARGFLSATLNTSIYDDYLSLGTGEPVITVSYDGTTISPDGMLDLGNIVTGHIVPFDIRITNTGDRKLEQIAVTSPPSVEVVQPPTNLQPGESGLFRIYTGRATEGLFTDSFTITSNSPANPNFQFQTRATSSYALNPVFKSATDTPIPSNYAFNSSHRFGQLTLEFTPVPGTVLQVLKGSLSPDTLRFPDLPDGSIVTADFGGVTYGFLAGYRGGFNKTLTLTLLPGDGILEKNFSLEGSFASTASGQLMQGDGSIIAFANRWDANGVHDPVFAPDKDTYSPNPLPQPKGNFLFAGATPSPAKFVRMHNDGSTDPTFSAVLNGNVTRMFSQPDGKILIAGTFTTVSGQTRNGLARIHPDGSLDPSFDTGLNLKSKVNAIAVQPDGKILVGSAANIPGTSSAIARFHPDGSLDSSFSLTATPVHQILIQPDGKIVVVPFVDTFAPVQHVFRVHSDGSPDTNFSLPTNGRVKNVALLADGRMLVTGAFTIVGYDRHLGLTRILPDGSVDPTFFGETYPAEGANQILLGNNNLPHLDAHAIVVNGVSVPAIASISNPTAATSVQLVNATTVRWMRQGGAAEMQWVNAELIPQGGGAPISLGMAQRIPGGWEVTSPTPISNATVHLSGPATNSAGTSVILEEYLEVGNVTPEMIVTYHGEALSQEVVHDLGDSLAGVERDFVLALENSGAGTLRAPTVTLETIHPADFTLLQSSAVDLRSGERRSVLLKVKPTGEGLRTARLVFRDAVAGSTPHVIQVRIGTQDTLDPVFNTASDVPLTVPQLNAAPLKLGTLTLGFAPTRHSVIGLIINTGTAPISGTLADLPQYGYVSTVYNGVTYTFLADYTGGDGNDLTLRLVGVGDTVPWFATGATTFCNSISVQPDGKMLVGGWTNTFPELAGHILTRLHPDGSVDTSFRALPDNRIDAMVTQDDGRIIVGGLVNNVEGLPRRGIARLNHDGSLDRSFDLRAINGARTRVDTNRLLKLRDSKILVGGQFTSMLDLPMQNIARLNEDGTLDQTFTTTIQGVTPETAYIYAMIQQADGKILIGGRFTGVNGVPRFGLARLNEDGTLDTSFGDKALGPNPGPVPGGSETRVSALIQQPDGKIVLSGEFTSVLGQTRTRLARLHPDGTLDTTFAPGANNTVSALALQEDGRLLVSGLFTQVSGETRTRIARLNVDGSLDPEFQPEVDGTISSMLLDRHGKAWIVGDFNKVSGLPTKGISKLENDGAGLSLAIINHSAAFWSAGTSAPVPREVKFELSTDGGATWSPLGTATKVLGGWSLENLTLPPHGFLRAKGYGIASNRTSSEIEETLLFGRPLTKIEQWRAETFGSPTNQRTGADLGDADKDGVKNLMEYAFNLDPQDSASAQVPAWTNDSSQFEINFTPPAIVEGVSYGVEWSSTMNPSDWQDVTNQGTGGNHHYVVPKDTAPLKFMRVKVTNTGSLPPP